MRILVVDDHSSCRRLLQGLLGLMGHQVDCAGNGRDAVLLFKLAAEQGRPYRFISMDNDMPVMTGKEAVEQIRDWEQKQYPTGCRTTICFISGDDTFSTSCARLDDRDDPTFFLPKPFDIRQFTALVDSVDKSGRFDAAYHEPLRLAA